MRCPKCRTLTLVAAGALRETGSLVRCPRCPAVWVARRETASVVDRPLPAPVTRRGPLIIDGKATPAAITPRVDLRRYGIAAGAAALMLALVAVVLLAPDVSALPGIAFLEGSR